MHVAEYQGLNLDFPGGEGQQTVKEAKQNGIYLWRQQWIIFPGSMSSPTRSTSSSPPPPEIECIPTPPHQPSPAPLPEMERSATPQHQPSPPAPSIPEMERIATPPRQPSPPQPPHEMERSASLPRQLIPAAPPMTEPKRQMRRGNRPPLRQQSPTTKKAKKKKPEPPVEKLPYERTDTERNAIVDKEVKDHFALKPPPPPKEKIPEEMMMRINKCNSSSLATPSGR